MVNIGLICTDNESLAFGMRSISAILKEKGYKSRLIFMETDKIAFSEEALNELSLLIRDYQVIGISCLANGSNKAIQVLEYLKPMQKTTIWGGIHASLNPDDCANWADYVCLGEGEGLIVEFMDRMSNSEDCRDLLNIAYKQNNTLIVNELRPFISNLDELPFPDFSFDDEYHLSKEKFVRVHSIDNVERNGQIAFTSSRGCAFRCTYCCNIKLKELYSGRGQYVRRMSVEKLLEHSRHLRKIFPKGRYFYFIDEDFTARPIKELEELSARFAKEVGLPFEILAHPARITDQKIELLIRAGLFRIRVGIETGSERSKAEIYNRHVSNEIVKHAFSVLSKYPQVAPIYFFIYANPYETREDLLDTLKLISELPNGSNIQGFELIFFPGSLLHERAITDKLINDNSESSSEVSYFGGLHFREYPWKARNLYLNGLIFLSGGLCTRLFIGSIPRVLLPMLIHQRVVDFNERHPFFIRNLIYFKTFLYQIRAFVVKFIKRIIKDPYAIYNFSFYIKNKLKPKINLPNSMD